ncbi:hypothetical protein BAU17_00905 [Enterococcus sp. CU12B]|uniref:DUF3324 domain-containing protein n=1 Tax=Candidatus Enterococcus willemsii TaxID=1857215 RepID=A0ABQ6YW86_9ENTE|nr:hypothetical protein BAU17_00905 [Enterococcus sp. CU12B]
MISVRRDFSRCFFSIVFFSLFFLTTYTVNAESLDSFDISIEPPASQTKPELMYYDLQLAPSKKEKLPIVITNKSEKELSLELSFNRAVNNMNGMIDYSNSSKEKSTSAPFDIEKFVTLSEEKILLPPEGTQTIYAEVEMPNQEFSGVLAGGVYIKQSAEKDFEGNVQNLFARELAILLRSDLTPVTPEFSINKAYSQQVNGRNAVGLQIENLSAAYVNQMMLNYEVMYEGEETGIVEEREINFAPNTVMDYFIPLNGKAFEPGTYTVNTTLVAGEQVWKGSSTFTVNREAAKKFNDTDVTIEKEPFPWLTLGIGTMVVLLIIVVTYLSLKNRKLQNEIQKSKK